MPSIDELLNESLLELSESETWERVEGYDISEYFSDEQQMVQIDSKNRTIGSLSENVSVFEENNSQYVTFVMDRYLDGIDLSTKTFNVQYENKSENIWGSNSPVDFYRSETRIKFGWLINNVATQKPIVLDIIVFCIGYVDTKEYVFKTRPMQYTIYNSNEIGGGEEHRPDESWYIQFMEQQVALVNESKGYRNEAAQSASSANASKLSALESEQLASGYATSASQSANSASQNATSAASDATKAQSYAVGGTGTREWEDTDNAKYYYEETRSISPTGVNERLNALEDKTEVLGSVKTIDFSPSIEFNDGLAVDAKDVKVAFEPKQDLHGYDKPWAGGAGKNKLPMTVDGIKAANTSGTWSGNTYTVDGVTFTILTDNNNNVTGIRANGTANRTVFFATGDKFEFSANVSYAVNGMVSTNTNAYLAVNYGVNVQSPQDQIQTFSSAREEYFYFIIMSGYTAANVDVYPMIRLATETDPTFEPYSNICPIEGYTDCEVEVTGKNLYHGTREGRTNNGVTYTVDNSTITASGTASATSYAFANGDWTLSNAILLPAGTYTISVNQTAASAIAVGKVASAGGLESYIVPYSSDASVSFTVESDTYICVLLRINNGATVNHTFNFQLEKGSTATAYESYQSTPYTIDLDGTRYGGNVNMVSGEMTVDKVIVDLGSLTWGIYPMYHNLPQRFATIISGIKNDSSCVCEGYKNALKSAITLDSDFVIFVADNYINIVNSNYNNSTEFKTSVVGIHCVYELATPFTVQLTPEQIRTLEGTNNISTNMDAIAIEYYGVNSAIGVLQNQLDGVKEVTIRVPEPPDTNGNYVLSVTVSDSGKSYAWVSN